MTGTVRSGAAAAADRRSPVGISASGSARRRRTAPAGGIGRPVRRKRTWPASLPVLREDRFCRLGPERTLGRLPRLYGDRKSTRLNSSHLVISYARVCL